LSSSAAWRSRRYFDFDWAPQTPIEVIPVEAFAKEFPCN
jgi:hypothetical protein